MVMNQFEEADQNHILIIEDDAPIRILIADTLRQSGMVVHEAKDGRAAFTKLRDNLYDLVLLDLRLEDMDGMEILKTIRRQDEFIPVIIVSSVQDLRSKLGGFEIGCDDYITKPFEPAELVGRVQRILRRCNSCVDRDQLERPTIRERIEAGPFTLDIHEHQVYRHGEPVPMRKKLFDLFVILAQNPNTVISQDVLLERVWHDQSTTDKNSVYVHVHQLRNLLETDPAHPEYIQTIRSVGFKLNV